MPAELLEGPGTFNVRLRVASRDVVWLRSVLESYEGLAALHGDGSGVVTLTTTIEQAPELVALLDELRLEASLQVLDRTLGREGGCIRSVRGGSPSEPATP